jgi:chaperonin cofactor prefoldin
VSGDYGLGHKVHEDAYCELEEEAERYRLEANAMMLQRDRLAKELKEAQDAIEMMLRDSSCRRIPAYTEEQLAAVKGGKP